MHRYAIDKLISMEEINKKKASSIKGGKAG